MGKSKSVNELSQISSLGDFPIPDTIENFVKTLEKKQYGPAERKKKIKEMSKSSSTSSLKSQGMYATLPRSLKMDLAVKTVEQDQEMVEERKNLLATKSISELGKVTSISDIPIPALVQKFFHKSMEALNSLNVPGLSKEPADSQPEEDKSVASGNRSVHENIYATLPKSLKSELLVSSSEEDPELIASRMELVNSKSVSELSQIKSLADFPVPETVEKLMEKLGHKGDPEEAGEGEEGEAAPGSPRPPTSLSVKDLGDGIYASLPRSLKDQLIVRTKEEPQDEVLAARRELVETKSPAELSEIHGLADFPLPTRIEAWVAGTGAEAATEGSDC